MKKSSRFWWLHGAILLSAVIGCKNCGGNSGSCGGPGGTPMSSGAGSSYSGPMGSAGGTMYSTNSMPSGYQGGATTATGSAFPTTTSPGYTMPNMSSTVSPGVGGVGR